jgi:hypothetical protein
MRERIIDELARIEHAEKVKVLRACESGSRAWGFPSADSDYDVRFIYVRPPEWYLSINVENKRDVLEKPITDELDVSGWDLRKALQLLRKSNPPLLEWLHSPIVYRERPGWAEGLRKLAAECYAPIACMHHYLHMARGNFREYLKGERVRVKKYFYVLRPVLACSWIEAGYGVAPVEFGVLAERLLTDEKLKTIILDLIERKRAGVEMDDGPALPEINDFLAREIERIEHAAGKQPAGHADLTKLDEFFRATLRETWGAAY